jgi:hypothetical protein
MLQRLCLALHTSLMCTPPHRAGERERARQQRKSINIFIAVLMCHFKVNFSSHTHSAATATTTTHMYVFCNQQEFIKGKLRTLSSGFMYTFQFFLFMKQHFSNISHFFPSIHWRLPKREANEQELATTATYFMPSPSSFVLFSLNTTKHFYGVKMEKINSKVHLRLPL